MFCDDAAKSLRLFKTFALPALKFFGAKKVVSAESESALGKILDFAGVDALVENPNGDLFGIASRVQWTGKNYESISIRRSRPNGATTEYQKILRAMKTDSAIRPRYHVQTFVDEKENCATVYVALTDEVIAAIKRHPARWRTNKDGETFYFTPRRELDRVKIYRVTDGGLVTEIPAAAAS